MHGNFDPETTIQLEPPHAGQLAAHSALKSHRFKALRSGRRFGKTELGKSWLLNSALRGRETAWFSPQYRTATEVFSELLGLLRPAIKSTSKSDGIIRLITGGLIQFWTLENAIAGRGRRYSRVVIDEAAFTKDGDNTIDGSMMAIWEKSIKPTLLDHHGEALVLSNSAGKNPDNFFYQICTDPKFGFAEYHATTMDNPVLPKRLDNEGDIEWLARREKVISALKADNDPLVYAQEYLAEFVDWSGAAFFASEKLLVDGLPLPSPVHCDGVFAVIDTASKTGTENDGTGVTYFALNRHEPVHLLVLDWDVTQIEGATLEHWLPSVFKRLEALARSCGARAGSLGAFIEDQNSGTILLQQALRRGWRANAIDSKLTALGKDERSISVSGYVHRGEVKYAEEAYNKTKVYKGRSMNHLVNQVESFRVGDKNSRREDDLLDTFCYGIAIALGNSDGF
ncbi:MAG TPA: terminase family protein [Chthoniobacterales bacterium]|jgi:hypothetical protein